VAHTINRARPTTGPKWDLTTAGGRVKWLLDTKYHGNRSAFAEAIGCSHTIISKVASGQSPGRKLLTAIAERLNVNPGWLLMGEGKPFRKSGPAAAIPVSRVLLAGPPAEHRFSTEDWIDLTEDVRPASQYWLVLTPSLPIVRSKHRGFSDGDRLLMETDCSRFPRREDVYDDLCIIRPASDDQLELAVVTMEGGSEDEPERLVGYMFQPEPEASGQWEDVYRHLPDGTIHHERRRVRTFKFRGRTIATPIESDEACLPEIEYSAIIAVWTRILFRPLGVSAPL
jgi:transcriptional regulator with XRE-family HTH domain